MKKEIPIFKPIIAGNEKKYLQECVETKWFSSRGPFVEKFEKLLSDYIGVKYALSTSSCTTALHLALKAIGIEQGDEVICPALTFISPIHMVSLAGATPVLVDIEEDSRGTVQLADHDTLGTVDHKGAVLSHQGDFTEVDLLLLDV